MGFNHIFMWPAISEQQTYYFTTLVFHTYVFLPDGSRERPYFKQRFKITMAPFRAPIASCFCVYWGENMSMYLLAIRAEYKSRRRL